MTDYIIRNAEILMAISNDYGYYLNPIQKDDLVKNKIGIFKSRAEKDYKTALEWFNKAKQQGDHMYGTILHGSLLYLWLWCRKKLQPRSRMAAKICQTRRFASQRFT